MACTALAAALGLGAQAWAQDAPTLRGADPDLSSPQADRGAAPQSGAGADIDPREAKKAAARKRLPPLKPYHNAQRLGLRGGPPADAVAPPGPTIAALPVPPPLRKTPAEENPFDPVGVSFGALRLKPYIEQDFGYSSNPQSLPGPVKGSGLSTTQGGVSFQSDWARNDLHGALHGGYTDYFSDPQANAPFGDGSIVGRVDVTRDASLDAETHFTVATQTPGAFNTVGTTVLSTYRRPLYEIFGGSAGGTQHFGDLALSLHGALDRTTYSDTTASDGAIANLTNDDSNDWTLRGRAAYQISPFIAPFVEVDVDRRIYDAGSDGLGYERDSSGVSALAGATFAFTGRLTGEADAGYGGRNYVDPRLPNITAPLFNASLIWSATPLTTVTLKAATNLSDTTTPSASGAISRSYQIGLSHALRRNLTLTANAGYGTDNYVGIRTHDQTTSFGVGAEYNVNRDIVLKASAERTQFTSSLPGANYIANVFMLGLKLQR